MDMRKYLDLFVEEAGEHIQGALRETGRLSAGHAPPEALGALFRHFHSIKGMAASMGFGAIGTLSHAAEDLFDRIRKGASFPPREVCDLTTEALDAMAAMVSEARTVGPGGALSYDPAPLAARLRGLIEPDAVAEGEGEPAPAGRPEPPLIPASLLPAARRVYRCAIAVDTKGGDPASGAELVLQRLEPLGEILEVAPPRGRLREPGFDGALLVRIASDRPQPSLFAAVSDLPDVKLFEVAELPAQDASIQTAAQQASGAEPPASVRVPTPTLDLLLDAIAEMVSRRGELAEAMRSQEAVAGRRALEHLSASIQRLRDQVMLIRLVPFEQITPRLMRAVRELCRVTDRRAVLHITGAGVSLDRSVLEEIVDPLLHILRNAMDHGIRTPAERERAGKPATGSLRLEVTRISEGVQVIVEDDGEGMDVDAIRRAALDQGYCTAAQLKAMHEEDIFMLTTIPGFSTAARVTEVSGRGVGMDIVRTRVEALHGHMAIRSRRGIGTRIEMTLPLSVAILDAFLVESAGQVFAVPASSIQKVQLVSRARVRSSLSGRFLVSEGEGAAADVVRLLLLDELLPSRVTGGSARTAEMPVLSYQTGGTFGALGVSRILGRREVVVKPLGPPLERMRRYSGAALLDDGSLALVLDLANLSATATAR